MMKRLNSDISKCCNTECTLNQNCLRFTAIANERQCYSNFKQKPDGDCDHFIDVFDIIINMTESEYEDYLQNRNEMDNSSR